MCVEWGWSETDRQTDNYARLNMHSGLLHGHCTCTKADSAVIARYHQEAPGDSKAGEDSDNRRPFAPKKPLQPEAEVPT